MKKIFIGLFIIILSSSLSVEAFDWNSALNFIGKVSENNTSETQPISLNELETRMTAIDNTVQSAFIDVVSDLSGWKETWNIKSQIKKSSEDTLTNIISNYTNTYLANNKQSIINKIQKMSAKEKTDLISDLAKLKESEQNYLLLATNGVKSATNALTTAQNLTEVTGTITNINRIAASLKNRATTIMTFANQVKTIANAAGVNLNQAN